ncbi:MAG: hypothetical protein JWP52_4171 [Rhizobacter sp.]|nr:hypothetical protein [Rhizobacter sp.]
MHGGSSMIEPVSAGAEPRAGGDLTAGSLLRQARESRGLPIEALAAAIKVTPRKLEALESNRFGELPDATFVRALAQAICRFLKIDPEPVMSRLPPPPGLGLEHATRGLNQPFRERANHRDSMSQPSLGRPAAWAAGLIVIAAGLVYLLPSSTWDFVTGLGANRSSAVSDSGADSAAAPSGVDATAQSDAPAAAGSSPAAESLPPPVAATQSTSDSVAAAVPGLATGVVAPAGAAAPAGENQVEFHVTADSWIGVTDATGKRLLSRLLVSGETVAVDGAVPLKVTVGNAAATSLKFRGQPVNLSPQARDNVARVELK